MLCAHQPLNDRANTTRTAASNRNSSAATPWMLCACEIAVVYSHGKGRAWKNSCNAVLRVRLGACVHADPHHCRPSRQGQQCTTQHQGPSTAEPCHREPGSQLQFSAQSLGYGTPCATTQHNTAAAGTHDPLSAISTSKRQRMCCLQRDASITTITCSPNSPTTHNPHASRSPDINNTHPTRCRTTTTPA